LGVVLATFCVLVATNRDIRNLRDEGRFRSDLYYRLRTHKLLVPPLRERRVDILPLANHFAGRFASTPPRLSPAVTAALEVYEWPGNVRELRNAMERATLMARGGILLPEHLPTRIQKRIALASTPPLPVDQKELGDQMEHLEGVVILQSLRDNDFNRTRTAGALGISRRALLYKLRRLRELGFRIQDDE